MAVDCERAYHDSGEEIFLDVRGIGRDRPGTYSKPDYFSVRELLLKQRHDVCLCSEVRYGESCFMYEFMLWYAHLHIVGEPSTSFPLLSYAAAPATGHFAAGASFGTLGWA